MSSFPTIDLDLEHVQYVQTLHEGWAAPLKNFMNELQLLEVLHFKTLTVNNKKYLQSVPITLPVSQEDKEKLTGKGKCVLRYNNETIAVIDNPVTYVNRKEEICTRVFGTFSTNHPKSERIMAEGDFLLSGDRMRVVKRITYNDGMDEFRLLPSEIKKLIKEKNADAVYGFQLRNPLHNGHIMLLKQTHEELKKRGYKNPVLLLHPLGGWVKDDDVPLDTRMLQHQALIEDGVLDKDTTILAIWPSPMYYGGPTEVLWHVSSRVRATDCQFFIVGRDPAGVKHPEDATKDLYDPFHGQKVLDMNSVKELLKTSKGETAEILPFKMAAYNKVSKSMEFFNPQKADEFDFISGSKMRALARDGELPPDGFMSEKGWKVLADYYKSLNN